MTKGEQPSKPVHFTGSPTGRVPTTGPSMQNIPVRTEIGRQIRDAFVKGQAK